jgi:hypothetical protein
MDVALYVRVLWRFRAVVLAGVILAVLLAAFSVARLDTSKGGLPSLRYRQSETWSSSTSIFITQQGFPLGRSFYDRVVPLPNGQSVSVYQDPYRFSNYAVLYAGLATSDEVKQLILRSGPLRGVVQASVPTQPSNPSVALPIVDVNGVATSPALARDAAHRATAALISYVTNQQTTSDVPKSQRVLLQVLNEPTPAVLVKARSKTRPVAAFLATLLMVIGLVFLLENVRPRAKAASTSDERDTPDFGQPERRTA